MKIRALKNLLPIMLFFILISCEKDNCIEYTSSYVTSVNSPPTGNVNETLFIEVNYGVYNGCGGFGNFIETENNNNRFIEVQAKYEGCGCTQYAPIRTVLYQFEPPGKGDYQLNFKSGPAEFIIVNIKID